MRAAADSSIYEAVLIAPGNFFFFFDWLTDWLTDISIPTEPCSMTQGMENVNQSVHHSGSGWHILTTATKCSADVQDPKTINDNDFADPLNFRRAQPAGQMAS